MQIYSFRKQKNTCPSPRLGGRGFLAWFKTKCKTDLVVDYKLNMNHLCNIEAVKSRAVLNYIK